MCRPGPEYEKEKAWQPDVAELEIWRHRACFCVFCRIL
jgi:hypothetical protein